MSTARGVSQDAVWVRGSLCSFLSALVVRLLIFPLRTTKSSRMETQVSQWKLNTSEASGPQTWLRELLGMPRPLQKHSSDNECKRSDRCISCCGFLPAPFYRWSRPRLGHLMLPEDGLLRTGKGQRGALDRSTVSF